VIRAARHPAYPSIARRVPEIRQRVVVMYIEFDYQCEQTKYPARGMSHRSASRNSDETSGNQCSYDNACFAWSVVATLYPAEKYTERERPILLHDSVESHIEFPITFKDISKFEWLTWCQSMCTALRINKSFLCSSPMTRRRSTSISCIYKIHTTTTLRVSRTCRVVSS